VDDASPDSCRQIVKEFTERDGRFRVLPRATNGGVAESLNSGFNVARGRYLTRLAQDDVFKPDAFRVMADFLDLHSDVALTYADQEFVDEQGARLSVLEAPRINPLIPANRMGVCVMWRRELMASVGNFDPACDFAEDYDFWLRVNRRHRIAKCDDRVLLSFRYHPAQNSIGGERKQLRSTERAFLKQRLMDMGGRPWDLRLCVRAVRHALRYWRLTGV
jgi:glycosyltransferase involved in cell wall biosynthesis